MYGNYSALVEEVLEFAEKGSLLLSSSLGEEMHNCIVIHDLDLAKKFAWSQTPASSSFSWVELREREMGKVLKARYTLPDFNAIDAALGGLIDSLGTILSKRLRGDYRELIDDVLGDLHNCAYQRAVFGYKDSLFEAVFSIYKLGGWPCGWQGEFPEGKLIVFIADQNNKKE